MRHIWNIKENNIFLTQLQKRKWYAKMGYDYHHEQKNKLPNSSMPLSKLYSIEYHTKF